MNKFKPLTYFWLIGNSADIITFKYCEIWNKTLDKTWNQFLKKFKKPKKFNSYLHKMHSKILLGC